MSASARVACTGEPISWLALEQYALAELDGGAAARVRAHVADCGACRGSLERITGDRRVLPALPALPAAVPVRLPWWRRWGRAGGLGLAVATAAALVLIIVRSPDRRAPAGHVVRWKGGALVLTLVRERDGVIAFVPGTPAEVRPDDRWKIQVTCPPAQTGWIDVAVYQAGQPPGFPLPAQPVACGNDVVLPGAFRITEGAATVCVVAGDTAPDRARLATGPTPAMACVALHAPRGR